MSDYERGPYTPPSERLAFDPREPVRSGPAPVTLIVSALLLVAIIGGVVLLYKGGIRHKGDAPAVVGASVNAIGAPPAPDANATAASGLTIDKTDNSIASPTVASAAPPAAALPPQPVTTAPVAVTQAPVTTAATPPKPVVTAAAAPSAATPAKPPKPLTIASLANDAVANHNPAPLRPAISAAPAPAAPPAGDAWAQIGAFSTSALADKGWTEIAAFDHTDMHGKGKQVEATTHNGATFYRTIVTGFSSHAAAVAFCDKLKAAHKPCITK